MARMLASSTRDSLKRINRLQGQLSEATNTFSETSADVLYDLGKDAGKGFLAGLAGQQKEIEKLMLQIAKAMQKSIRKALDIRSPSQVMRRIGELTGDGLRIGLLRRMAVLREAVESAAGSLAAGVKGQLGDLGVSASIGGVARLTRTQRARTAGQAVAPTAGSRGRAAPAGATIINNWQIREVGDAHVTAQRVLNRFVLAAGVSG
ncbi:hypothetical protein ACR6C2_07510 [Streptomyces sp. INA 01156]